MSDIAVENYKKSVAKVIDIWAKEMDKCGKALAPILEKLAELEAVKSPDSDTKKQIADLKKQEDAIQQRIDAASTTLRINLMVLDVPPQADEKELMKVPAWLKDIIKAKGIPLGKGVSIAPTVDFDFKKKQLKSFGIKITFP
jgi:seryl-tRNA synthetase